MINIQEITTDGCPSCATAKKILEEEIKPQFSDVQVEYIDMLSEEGQKLVQKHGIMSSPGILINGELFSSGALNRDKLKEKIQAILKALSPNGMRLRCTGCQSPETY